MRNLRKRGREDPLGLLSRASDKFHNLWLASTYPFAAIGKQVWIHPSCDLRRSIASYVWIGDRVMIERNVWINIAEIPDNGEPAIILEDDCKLQRGCVISAKNQIHIERNTIFGPSVFVTDHDHAYEDVTSPIGDQGQTPGGTVRIEQGSWIGYSAAIVCSRGALVIGQHSIVGANAMVARSIRPCSVVVGNPARTVKHYDPAQEKWLLGGGPNRNADAQPDGPGQPDLRQP